jgi:hypothetical protein
MQKWCLELGVIIFGSVFTNKNNQNKTETGSNRPVSVPFGSVFYVEKPKKPILFFFLLDWRRVLR